MYYPQFRSITLRIKETVCNQTRGMVHNQSHLINVLQPDTKGVPLKFINNSVLNFLNKISYKAQCHHFSVSSHSTLMPRGEATYRRETAYWFACTASFAFIIRTVSPGHKVFCHSKRRHTPTILLPLWFQDLKWKKKSNRIMWKGHITLEQEGR